MRKLMFLLICFFMAGLGMANAQSRSVSGKVVSAENEEPIIGASVVVKGTNTGTVTNVNGNFSITIPSANATLVISYVGMKTVEVAATNNLIVRLESDTEALDEVLVVAYGTTRREAKTGSITSVSSDQITNIPVSSVDKMLSGKLAGVTVTSISGQPGSASSVRIRGTSSINAGNEPLYVVDGIAVMTGDQSTFTNTNNALAMINPSDIESVTVLKDAAAASVYGSRAANGVILITTKSGSEGKSKFGVRLKRGVSSLANDNDFGVMTPSELLSYQRQAVINSLKPDGSNRNPDDPTDTYYRPNELLTRTQTNWMDHFTRLGNMEEYEITAQGGSAKTKTYNSFSYHKNEGVYYGVGFQKMQARTNVEHELTKKLKIGTKINLGYMYGEDVPMQSLYYANPAFAGMTILPWSVAYTEDGKHNTNIAENAGTNPRATAEYDDQWEKQYRLNGNMFLEYKPVKGLTLKTTNAAEMNFTEGRRYWSPETNEGVAQLQTSQAQYRLLTTSNTATYDSNIEKHFYRILAGQEATHRNYMYNYQTSKDLDPKIPYHVSGNTSNDIDYSENTSTLLSYFGVLDYNFDARYYLQASLRYDASSKFGKNNQWGLFYSVGGSWNIHNEEFLKGVGQINLLKLRASYGLNGNNNIGDYFQYGVYASASYNGVNAMLPSTPANDNLSWEKNGTWNAGLDFRFLKMFSGSFDVYSRTTTDMLLDKPLSSTTGFIEALQNVGSMRNDGFEFQLDADLINRKNLNWTLGFNLSHNKSKILELSGEEMMDYSDDSRIKHIVGERLFTYFVRDYYGVNPVNGEALWVTKNGELTNNFNKAELIKAGSPEPKLTGGINTALRLYNFTLSTQIEYKYGNNVFIIENRYLQSDGNQMSMNQSKSALNYWKNPGDTGVNPKPIAGNASNSYSFATDRFIERGDFMRIKDLTLSYDVPSSVLKAAKISGLKVYASGYNVFTFHDVNFWDPERGETGMGYGIYPMTKTFVLGVDLSF